tara:strand:+ start:349 stop:711 length:363 start_codon:yes stop_codon:yes gene_type:complete
MKYPKLRAEWVPGTTDWPQIVRVYKNNELITEEELDANENSIEFFVPAWDGMGNLLEEISVAVSVQTISDNFPSEIIVSNNVQLSSITIAAPSEVKLEILPFPEFHEDVETPVVPASGVI